MGILFVDFETYYDKHYNLAKLAPPNYILDPRFQCHGCAFRTGEEEKSTWIDGPWVSAYLRQFDPATTQTVAFNALFDNCILAWRYGFVPMQMFCTMRMAVALRGHMLPRGNSLAKVGEFLGVGHKGYTVAKTMGLRGEQIVANDMLYREFREYACNDNDISAAIFWKLLPDFPKTEWGIMDMVLRAAVRPKFQVDTEMLREYLNGITDDRYSLLEAAGVSDPSEVRSSQRFTELLLANGVEVEYKPSHTNPDAKIPCFAKTDAFMTELLESDDPVVAALAAARLGWRSTINQSRGERIMSIANLEWPLW